MRPKIAKNEFRPICFRSSGGFCPPHLFNKIVSKYNGDFHAKELNSYSQLLHLLFGQLTGCSSLHEICLCLLAPLRHPIPSWHKEDCSDFIVGSRQ
ncbi:MAG: DUF4372 domain-containing protein [Bacteroidales bacterium]|nr:DUF4372 domain-containing protein [Bacteroidales bacterium]